MFYRVWSHVLLSSLYLSPSWAAPIMTSPPPPPPLHAPLFFFFSPLFVERAPTILQGPEGASACSVWWSVSLREILTANHLSSCGVLLGFTFQWGAISYIPARRAVSCLKMDRCFFSALTRRRKWLWLMRAAFITQENLLCFCVHTCAQTL